MTSVSARCLKLLSMQLLQVHYHSVLNKSLKLVSCVEADYESRKQIHIKPINSILYRGMGLLLMERKGMYYAEVYMYLEFVRLKTT